MLTDANTMERPALPVKLRDFAKSTEKRRSGMERATAAV
jgi:hypothetical protein